MGTALHHFCNREFIEELVDLYRRNVLLLMIDGSAVFGRIVTIDGNIAKILPPVGIVGYMAVPLAGVEFRPPNDNLAVSIFTSEVLVDVCNIAAVVEGTFLESPLTPVNGPADLTQSMTGTVGQRSSKPQCELIGELEQLEGTNAGVTVLGGWTVSGEIAAVNDCIAVIGPSTANNPFFLIFGAVSILGPALPLGLVFLFGAFRAWVNLKALVQVLEP